jgi:hypothetical protein
VDSFVPKATVKVFLNGTTLIGGPIAPKQGFYAVPLTQALHVGDKITATQTVNGVTSVPSQPMVVGAMPAKLPRPRRLERRLRVRAHRVGQRARLRRERRGARQ